MENVDIILVDRLTTFGNGVEATVLNETGGREVLITTSCQRIRPAYWPLYRHRPELINRMKAITDYIQ
ncbi:DUF4954 family protein [Bacteroides ovatus]|nr:DUF4954 family protein [Bacteroides ovatus]